MRVLLNRMFTLSALLPQLALLYAFVNFSLNIISIILCFVIILFIPVYVKKISFHFNINAFLFIILSGILYIFESSGGLILLLSLLVYFVSSLNKSDYFNKYYDLLKSQLKIFFLLSFISYFLFVFGLTNPYSFQDFGRGQVYLHYFLLSDFPSFEFLNPNTWRFYAFLNEPGAAAAVSGTIILKERFSFKGNEIFWATIFASFSTGIFVALMISYLVLNFKKEYFIIILILIIMIISFYFVGANSSSLFVSYLHEKMFYFTYEFFSYKDDRLQFSFLNYLFQAPIFFFLYILMLAILPSRFIIFFILIGLYRHHFILNSIPFLLLIFYQNSKVDIPLFNKLKYT